MDEILDQGAASYYARVQELFSDPSLRVSLRAQLRDERLIGQGVELGDEVIIEKGAAILGRCRILRGKVEKAAIVVDSVIKDVIARAGSVLLGVEQLDDTPVIAESGQLLGDVLIIDGGIVRKVRIASPLEADLHGTTVLVDDKRMSVPELVKLADFEASYLGGSASQFRQAFLGQSLSELFPRRGPFVRFEGNPILEPIAEHSWESKLVYNPAVIRLEGITYIVYRALGDDRISRLGLAWSQDGLHIDGRLSHPIFVPQTEHELAGAATLKTRPREKGGCEDPRLTLIGDRVYMAYTAYGSTYQIALASISKQDFVALPRSRVQDTMSTWTRHGPIFSGILDKDATLFPQKINGRYAMLRRPVLGRVRDIAISFSDTLQPPWQDEFQVILKTRPGSWDAERVGAGPPVLKTRHGWLLIYHGVGLKRGRRSYMLGTALLDLNDPRKVLYRSADPVFIPEREYELYGWAPNVVFGTGIVARGKDANEMVEDADEILIYYGGGDQVVGVAWAKLCDLIPSTGKAS